VLAHRLPAEAPAEDFGHIELVAATINSMLTGASPTSNGDGSIEGAMTGVKDARKAQQFIAGGHAALPQDFLLVPGGVHQVAYARALENLTGADLTKMFPTPRIPTEKATECKPHIERGDHKRLCRLSPNDFVEVAAVFNGRHPETGDELEVFDGPPEGAAPNDLPPQPKAFVPDFRPEEVAEIAAKLRTAAGLPKEPSGESTYRPVAVAWSTR
jgi:manganese catalase